MLLVSALEAAANVNAPAPEQCKGCGQPKYAIRQRVLDLARKHVPNVECFIDAMYRARSGFLHKGLTLSDRSFAGVSVPQLDPQDSTGCVLQRAGVPNSLRELARLMLLGVFAEVVEARMRAAQWGELLRDDG